MIPASSCLRCRAARGTFLPRAALVLVVVATAAAASTAAQPPDPDGSLAPPLDGTFLPGGPYPPDVAPPPLGSEPLPTVEPVPGAADAVEPLPTCEFLVLHRLWQVPLASRRAPRMFVVGTTLDEDYTTGTIDTAIGGIVGLVRYNPPGNPDAPFQLDAFAVHFSRWSDRAYAVVSDYRYGLPLTWASGGWQAKVGYEHTSTHLGDDYVKTFQRYKERYVRDEIVLGLAYRWWNQLRLYGEFAYAFNISCVNEQGPERYEWGLEWSKQGPTGRRGQPFAALDMDLRPEQDFQPNTNLQIGWQWIPPHQVYSLRLAAEFYHGYAPYGQLFSTREKWAGLGFFFDF
jgi:hypothetical protein